MLNIKDSSVRELDDLEEEDKFIIKTTGTPNQKKEWWKYNLPEGEELKRRRRKKKSLFLEKSIV